MSAAHAKLLDALQAMRGGLCAEISLFMDGGDGSLTPPPAELPEWIHLVPGNGVWRGHWGQDVVVLDDVVMNQIMANFERRGIDMMVDWEHESMWADRSPAAGWVDRIELRDDGIWGHVKLWTPTAAKQLQAREYRFLSPVIKWHETDRVTGEDNGAALHSAALTNNPFFHELEAVIAATNRSPPTMLIAMLSALCLKEDATEAEAVSAIEELTASQEATKSVFKVEEVNSTTLEAARRDLVDGGHVDTVAAKFAGLDPKTATTASLRSRVMDSRRQLLLAASALDIAPEDITDESIRAAATQRHSTSVEAALTAARDAGKLTPDLESWGKSYAEGDLQGFQAWAKNAQAVVPTKSPIVDPPTDDDAELSAEDLAVAKQLNVSAKAFKAARGGNANA